MRANQTQTALLILFSDISGSTRLYEIHGDNKALEIINRTIQALSNVVTNRNGRILKTIGDEIMCAFDDSENAVTAACDMHLAVASDPLLSKFNIAIKTGMQLGEVISEDGDIFGDTVNTAARMVSLAKPDQIIITREIRECLSPELTLRSRDLGQVKVQGKKTPVDIAEIFWQEDFSDLTIVPGMIKDERPPRSALHLRYQNTEIRLQDDDTVVRIGRNDQNDVVVNDDLVSRMHASVQCRRGQFYLADHSANGTFVATEHGEIAFLHRDELRLHGRGKISLGLRFSENPDNVLHYLHKPIDY